MRLAKSQKTQERSKNWTSFEAHNIILAKQTETVQRLCNLGNDFKKLVFSLWATYLEKNDVAFADNAASSSLPRLQQFAVQRDFDFIVKGEKEMNRTRTSRSRRTKAFYRLGNRKIRLDRGTNPAAVNETTDEDSEHDDEERPGKEPSVGQSSVESSSGQSSGSKSTNVKRKRSTDSSEDDSEDDPKTAFQGILNECLKFPFQKLGQPERFDLFMKIYAKKDEEPNESDEESESRLEQQILDEQIKLNLMQGDEERRIQSDHLLALKERLHFSTYAKNLIKLALFRKRETGRSVRALSIRDVNHMTSFKLICLIYIAIRLMNYDIYLYDLIRWIEFTEIPYYDMIALLPDDWCFMGNEHISYVRPLTPQLFKLNAHITALTNYLNIPRFPLPDLKRLILRIAGDLNLPDSLAKFVCNVFDEQLEANPKVKLYLNEISGKRWFEVPEYELVALGLIFLSLKHLFCLDDYHETQLSEQLRASSSSSDAFIWSDWEEHTKFKLECFVAYIYPMKSNVKGAEIQNHALLADYYSKWLNREGTKIFEQKLRSSLRNAKHIQKEVPNLFERFVPDAAASPKIEPSYYPFDSFREYIGRHFNTRNDDLLHRNFRDKRIDYLFENDCRHICAENPALLAPDSRNKRNLFDLNNDKIKFLLSLSSLYLAGANEKSLMRTIIELESHFFPDYFETVEAGSRKRQEIALRNAETFIGDYVNEISLEEDDKMAVKCRQLKILEI